MVGLASELFRGDARLGQCLVKDAAHVVRGDKGPYVAKIQYAVLVLEGGTISADELRQKRYGPDTAKCVLAYKTLRKIINRSYQSKPDDIVGKMTIRSLDTEMVAFEAREKLCQCTLGAVSRVR
jgi:hypothetical protein